MTASLFERIAQYRQKPKGTLVIGRASELYRRSVLPGEPNRIEAITPKRIADHLADRLDLAALDFVLSGVPGCARVLRGRLRCVPTRSAQRGGEDVAQ